MCVDVLCSVECTWWTETQQATPGVFVKFWKSILPDWWLATIYNHVVMALGVVLGPLLPTESDVTIGFETWSSYQIRKFAGCACAGNIGNVFPFRDPDMHGGTCVTHVPWCMPGSLTSVFLWSRWGRKLSRHSRHMRNPQFYASGNRPMDE